MFSRFKVIFLLTALGSFIQTSSASQVAQSNNKFTFDLFKILSRSAKGSNVLFSPLSISAAMAMTSLGARGNTLKEIDAAFHFQEIKNMSTDPMILHRLFQELITSIDRNTSAYTLNVANQLFSQNNIGISQQFLKNIENFYKSSLQQLDFASGNAHDFINNWVTQKTHGKIRQLVDPGTSFSEAALVVVNAIYFKGSWKRKFPPESILRKEFHVSSTTSETVDMMTLTDEFPYAEVNETLHVKILELPYFGGQVSMIILLPELGKLDDLLASLTAAKLDNLLSNLRTAQVHVALPKFKIEARYSLTDSLRQLGINDLFSDKANLKTISPIPLKISDAVHKAVIEVNEEGTSASSATGLGLGPFSGLPSQRKHFNADHPFLFLLVNNKRFPQIVFIGSFVNP